jgi:hypothetical protein
MSAMDGLPIERWSWLDTPEAARAPRLRRDLAERGVSVIRADIPELSAGEAVRAPWEVATRLLGERPVLVERQPIKAVPGGRSFASSAVATPLHTDSQLFGGAPPDVQVMVCARRATHGGECVLADAWSLLDQVRAADEELYALLFGRIRRIPFVFGDVFGPTVSLRGGRLVFTHSPIATPGDSIANRLAPFLARTPRFSLSLDGGEILVVDNHRMLHGRNAFAGGDREFTRLLVWTDREISTHPEHRAAVTASSARIAKRLVGAPEAVQRRLGLAPAPSSVASTRLAVVLEMLRGVPPGRIAAREGIPEPELYRMRDAALAAAAGALSERALLGSDEEVLGALTEER